MWAVLLNNEETKAEFKSLVGDHSVGPRPMSS